MAAKLLEEETTFSRITNLLPKSRDRYQSIINCKKL